MSIIIIIYETIVFFALQFQFFPMDGWMDGWIDGLMDL